jgi:hypothetical protein
MDVHIRFWDSKKNEIGTRYFNSEFLGHSTADDLLDKLMNSAKDISPDLTKILQVSMDGPNVNWKLYDLLCEELRADDPSAPGLINIGSCSLHTVHNAFKAGQLASEFGVRDSLGDLHYLFSDCPARRADFLRIIGPTGLYPLKFCKVRWVENVKVVQRAKQIWSNIERYVQKASDKKEKGFNEPTCKSYKNIKAATADVLMPAKMAFFESVASQVEPYLKVFQSDKPIFPFITCELEVIIRALMKRFVKPEVLNQATNAYKLLKVDLGENSCVTHSKVDIGFEADRLLKDLKGKVSDRQVMEFKMSCLAALKTNASKLMDKTPIAYGLARSLQCLHPNLMAVGKKTCLEKFKVVQTKLVETKWLQANRCDQIKWEFETFLDRVVVKNKKDFEEFDYTEAEARLDSFLFLYMGSNPAYSNVWNMVKTILILSHGQASVERGFSVNKQILIENMKEHSFVGQRLVHEFITTSGGLKNVVVNQQMLLSASQGRAKYHAYLREEKEKNQTQAVGQKRKRLHDEMAVLKKRKVQLRDDITLLQKSACKMSDQAEQKRKFDLLIQANTIRHRAEEKEVELEKVQKEIGELEEKIKSD